MSLNDKAILPDDHALDSSYALRPSTAVLDASNGEWASSAPMTMAETASGPQLSIYFHALRRHWVLATGLGLLIMPIIGAAVWFGMGASYTASAYLKCLLKPDDILKAPYAPPPTEMEFDVFKNTQLSLMTNPLVLNASLRREETVREEKIIIGKLPILADEDDPVDWLTRKLSISFPRKDEILKVSITTKNPTHSAAIVQAVVNAYVDDIVNAERNALDAQISKLKNFQVEKTQEVKDALNELRRMAASLGTSETETLNLKQKNTLDELATVRSESIRSQFELNRVNAELASLEAVKEASESQQITDVEVSMTCQADPILQDLGKQLVYEQQSQEYLIGTMVSTSKSGGVQSQLRKLGQIQAKYKARIDSLKEELANKKRNEVERDIKRLGAQVEILKKQSEVSQEELKELRKEADRFGMSSIDMQMRRAGTVNAQKALDGITAELETLNVQRKRAPRVSKMNQDVEVPRIESSFLIRVTLTSFASLIGFCVPFLGVVVWDLQMNRINGVNDVADQLGLPVIGSVPRIPAKILHHQGVPKKSHQTWQLRLTESIDGISARLLRQAETEQRRVVMVTSAVNGEGKTTLTYQLAMSLARAGRRTLLVDFDLRQPTFDEVFGVPRTPGLSEILRGECDLTNCIHATGTENLSVLTAGCWDRFALAALANNSVASMFKELREDYEFVIVDTSPILPIADTRFVSQYVDSVVLCVFRDVSQAPRIRSACEMLEAFGVRSVEAVVTGVTDNVGGNRLGYYQPAANETSQAG
jgi:polysaccharide biosynthesis transport protein